MFEDKVPARKFKYSTTFDAGEMMEKMGNSGLKSIVHDTEHVEEFSYRNKGLKELLQ